MTKVAAEKFQPQFFEKCYGKSKITASAMNYCMLSIMCKNDESGVPERGR